MLLFTKLVSLVSCVTAVTALSTGAKLIKHIADLAPSLNGFVTIRNFRGNVLTLTNDTSTAIVNGTESVTAMPVLISEARAFNQQVNKCVYFSDRLYRHQ